MTTSIGAGLGSSVGIAAQPTYGATFVTSTRWPIFKSFQGTYNQLPVQGGPYLQQGVLGELASARIILLPAVSSTSGAVAKTTMTGDMVNTGMALLVAASLGSSATMTQIGTTTAYQLGGAGAASISAPDLNNNWVDVQLGNPLTSGLIKQFNFHSGVITKATWVFDRTGIVSYSYDWFFQFVETTTALQAVTEPASPVPFAMQNSTCLFKMGTFGSEAAVDGVKKATYTIERQLAIDTERLYMGNLTVDNPVTKGKTKISVDLECDYTSAAKTAAFDLQLAGTATSILTTSVGNAIGASGSSDTFGLTASSCFLDTGGEALPKGSELLGNTLHFSGTIDTSGDPELKCTLISADTGF